MKYDYDAHGNWTRKTIEKRQRVDQPFVVSSIEQRTLTYYDEDTTSGHHAITS